MQQAHYVQFFSLLLWHLSKSLGDRQALIAVHKYLFSVACYVCMRTGALKSKLVTDSLGWIIVIFRRAMCARIPVLLDWTLLERLLVVVVIVGMVSSSSVGHSVGEFDR